jgi:hypothetical protein
VIAINGGLAPAVVAPVARTRSNASSSSLELCFSLLLGRLLAAGSAIAATAHGARVRQVHMRGVCPKAVKQFLVVKKPVLSSITAPPPSLSGESEMEIESLHLHAIREISSVNDFVQRRYPIARYLITYIALKPNTN